MQFLIKHYPSELFIKLQETANSGEQIFLMSSSPGGLFWCHPLFPSADILGSLWLWLPICLKRQPSFQRERSKAWEEGIQSRCPSEPLVPPLPCPVCQTGEERLDNSKRRLRQWTHIHIHIQLFSKRSLNC